MANEKNLTLYRSPQWALVLEIYIAVEAIIVGFVGGLKTGPLGITLHVFDEYYLWTLLFCGVGFGLLVTTLYEFRCRMTGGDTACIRRFAVAREWFNVFLIPCWGFAALLLFLSNFDLVLTPCLAIQALVFVLVIQWENVSAQHKRAEERRGGVANAMRYIDGLGR